MSNALYTNNFRGRAGRRERAKHIVDEFKAIEDGFTRLQALNLHTYLTTYVNTTNLSGAVTIRPDNGYLQEITLTSDTTIQMSNPLSESQYRVSLMIHGAGLEITNGWGAQTWKEYGQGNWWKLHTGDGPYASMLLDFFWDICSHTWICVASSKNRVDLVQAGTEQRLYPLQCHLSNIQGDDTLGFTRASSGQGIDQNQAYHYHDNNVPRFHGARWIESWCATSGDLTSVAFVPTDCTVTTDAGAGPVGEDVQRLSFDVQGGKLSHFILPAFGRASTAADSIKVVVSFNGRGVSQNESVRVVNSFMGKYGLNPPVHDAVQVNMDTTWQTYGVVLDILKEGNANYPLALDRPSPRTLMEIAFMSPSGSVGGDIQITDVKIEVLRGTDEELVNADVALDTSIGASIALIGTGTGNWVDGTKTLTLSSVGQSVDLSSTLKIGRTYLVHPRLQSGDAADIRLQNEVTVWAAGSPAEELYVQDAPFTFQYDGGNLKFVLMGGSSAVYLVDVYEVSGDRAPSCSTGFLTAGANGELIAGDPQPVNSNLLNGVAREVSSTNEIPFQYFRSFNLWDQAGLSGVAVNDCRNPVFQSEYGIDGWPSRATILQGASRVSDGFIQRTFSLTPSTDAKDFQMFVRRTLDAEGNQTYTPQHNDVTVPISQYIDFEAELIGGASAVESGRVRLDIQNASFVGLPSGYNYVLGIYLWKDWYMINIHLQNDGTHDTFRVRVYPSSADDPDPSVVDVTNQGWVVIDWAQFETEGGTHHGSSPIVGGELRATEDFTSGLPDGEFYRSENNINAGPAGQHVASLVSGTLYWTLHDGVYKNLIYTTDTYLADPNPRNMHEFGLVDGEAPPAAELTILTTTLYPIEAQDSVQMSMDITYGDLRLIPHDQMDHTNDVVSLELYQILISSGIHHDQMDHTNDVVSIDLPTILLSSPIHHDQADHTNDLVSATLEDKLVVADSPDEKLQLSMDINPSKCHLTPV